MARGVRRRAALLRLQAAVPRRSTTSTTSCARRAPSSTSPSAPRRPTCAGRVALLTGGRVKIGYQAGIKLLRAGAPLIVTTRFPRDSAARYAAEPDFDEWGDRLEIYGLDLRHTPSVEALLPPPARDPRPARLHRQQRLPDGAPAAGLLPPHDGAGDGRARHDCRIAPARCSGRTTGCAARRSSPTSGPRSRAGRRRPGRCRTVGRALAGARCCRRTHAAPGAPVPRRARSTRTCSRSTCATGTRGGSRSPRCRRSSCSRRSS